MQDLELEPSSDPIKRVDDRTSNFTGREWVVQAIHRWLSDPNASCYFLLTGEPGAGKTAISDRLIQFSQSADHLHPDLLPNFLSAVHHCSARDSTSVDPKTLARQIAFQLAQSVPPFAKALKNIGEKQVNINVDLSVGTANDSTIQAVVIHNLDLSGVMTAQEAFNWVVLNPLHAIYQAGFDQQITILVDALDEALTHEGDRTIVDLLANLDGLPPQVRFILTSRKVPQVENKFLSAEELNLSAPEFDIHNQADIRAYIQTRISQTSPLSTHLSNLEPQLQESAIDQITQKSDGNFLYVRFLLDAIEREERSLTNLEGLPEGLDGLYYESLERVIDLGRQDWRTTYAPIIGVLSVARISLTLTQLQAFTQQTESTVWQCLCDLRQFLEELELQSPSTAETSYRLYHQSVVDFLRMRSFKQGKNSRHNPYYLPPQEFHQQIAHHYWQPSQALETLDLQHLDSYAYNHLAYHLLEGDRTANLHQLLTASPQWMEAKFIHCQGDAAYAADLDLAISSFADPLTPAQLLCLLQLHAARQVVAQRANRYDNVDLRTLVWLGRETEALNQVRLRPQTQRRFWGLFILHKLLLERGQPCADLLTELQTIASVIEDPKAKSIALGGVAHALAKSGQQTASLECFADSQQWANQIDNPTQRAIALKELVASLAQTGYFAKAEAITRTIDSPRWQAWSLANLGASLAQSGQPQAAAPLFADAEAIARTLPNEYEQTSLFTEIVEALLLANDLQAANRVAQTINRQDDRAKALANVGSAWANAGNTVQATLLFTEVETLARSIDWDVQKGEVLRNLTRSLTEARRYAEAERVALSIENDEAKTNALVNLAAAVAQDHQIEDAIAEAERIATFIQDNGGKAFVLRVLAMVQAKAGRTAEATQLFQSAGAIAPAIEDPQVPVFALVVLGMTTKKAGHQEESEEIFQAALAAAKFIQNEIDQRTTLRAIVTDLAEQGLTSEAEQFAQIIQEPLERAGTLQQVAISYALFNEEADAQRLFQEVEALAKLDHDNQHDQLMVDPQASVLADLSQALAKAGYFAESERVALLVNENIVGLQPEALTKLSKALAQKHHLEEAERVARSISTDKRQRIDALSSLAVALARAGQETTSATLLAEAQQLALTIESPNWKPWALRIVATAFIQLGQWTKAEDIISTIEDKQYLGWAWQELATASQDPNYIAKAKQVAETDLISFQQVGMFQDLAKLILQLDQPAEAEELFVTAEQAVNREIPQYQASLLKDLAISHAKLGRFSSAKEIIARIDRWIEQDKALIIVAKELSQVDQFSEAKHLIWAVQDDKEQRLALGSLAIALMKQHRFAEALDTLGTQTPDDFIHILASAAATLEQLEVGLSSPVLSHILHIIGWVRPDWQKIATILSPLTSLAPSTTR